MQFIEASHYHLRSAVWVLRRGQAPLRFRLFPMVHVGSPRFYEEVARRVALCDIVVAEGEEGDEPPPPRRSALRTFVYKVYHRVRAPDLGYQYIDYRSMGLPVVRPDLAEPSPDRAPRPLWYRLRYAAFLVGLPFVALWILGRGGATFLEGMSGLNVEDTSLDDLDPGVLDEMVLHDRDLLLVEALTALQEKHEMDDLEIAVVYGAAHMPAVIRHLATVYGYRPTGAEWLTVYGATYRTE